MTVCLLSLPYTNLTKKPAQTASPRARHRCGDCSGSLRYFYVLWSWYCHCETSEHGNIYTQSSIQSEILTTTHEPLHACIHTHTHTHARARARAHTHIHTKTEFLQPYTAASADALFENGTAARLSCFVARWALVTNTSWVQKYYQSVYCCLIRHFLDRIHTAKCFTNGGKRFRSEVMFDTEHTFCSLIQHIRTCTTSAQVG
jgi:hypothetical protein